METLGMIRWVVMGLFVVLFYLSKIKKRKAFEIPAHLAILIAILLHAIVRDWPFIIKAVIISIGMIGVGGNMIKLATQQKEVT